MAMTDEEKMVYLHNLGDDRARDAELARMKDPLKAVVLKQAYGEWKRLNDPSGPGAGAAIAQGVSQGFTGGLAEELGAGMYATGYKLSGGREPFKDIYKEKRDEARAYQDLVRDRNPKTMFAAELVSGAVSPINKLGVAGAGAAAGFGYSKADLTEGELADAALDTAVGGVAGHYLGKTGAAASKVIAPVTGALTRGARATAALEAFRAAYPSLANLQEIDEARAIEIGRRMLDEGVVGPLSSAKGIAAKTAPKKTALGQEIGEIDAALSAKLEDSELPLENVRMRLRSEAATAYPTSADRDIRTLMESEADALAGNYVEKPFRFGELRAEKTANYRKGYETQDFQPTRRAGGYRQLGHRLGKQYNDYAEWTDPELAARARETGQRFADLAEADEVAQVSAARERKKGNLSLTDIATAGTGTAMLGPLGGVASLGLKKLAESRGHAVAAFASEQLATLAAGKRVTLEQLAAVVGRDPEALDEAQAYVLQLQSQRKQAPRVGTKINLDHY